MNKANQSLSSAYFFRVLIAVVLVGAITLPALAHHSGAAFDMSKEITLKGTIKNFRWTMPHSALTVVVSNDNGGADEWTIEGPPVTMLTKQGWKMSDVPAGANVSVTVNPLRSGGQSGNLVRLRLADGRVLRGIFEGGQPGYAPSPSVSSSAETVR